MSLKCECGEKAGYIWFDHNPDKLIPICSRCLRKLTETFGEVNLNIYDMDDPDFLSALIKDVNRQLEWHEKMRETLMLRLLRKEENSRERRVYNPKTGRYYRIRFRSSTKKQKERNHKKEASK